jgi:hypothetical protein
MISAAISRGEVFRRNLLMDSIASRYERIEAAIKAAKPDVDDFRFKGRLTRKRALRSLQGRSRECELCFVGRSIPVAIWAFLKTFSYAPAGEMDFGTQPP